MKLVDISQDSLASRLAQAVNRRVGLRADDALRKVNLSLAGMAEASRVDHVERLLNASPYDRDWISFVESLLVHETYFFRHSAQLDLLRDDILPRLDAQRRQAGRPELLIWIAGCSTGEEAWTLAFLAQHARRPGGCGEVIPVSILATDLSERSVVAARHGVYDRLHGLDSFRALPAWAAPYFNAEPGAISGWIVPDALRTQVRFLCHNVLDPAPVHAADLVLCRNLLIYLDEAANRRAQEHLVSSLLPGGVLVLGPADVPRTKGAVEAIETESATVYVKRALAA